MYEDDLPDKPELCIRNVVPTATTDFTTGAATEYLYEEMTVKALRMGDGTFEAVMVPLRHSPNRFEGLRHDKT